MKKKKIVSKHVLADRFPLLCAILWMLIGIYGPNTAASTLVEPIYEKDPDFAFLLFFSAVIVISMIIWALFERWFYPEYEGSTGTKGLVRGFKYAAPVILFVIGYRIFKVSAGFEKMDPITLDTILRGCRPGFNEEIFFRGIAVTLLLRKYKDNPRKIWFPAVITGVLFGLFHLTNVTSLEDFEYLWISIAFATIAGILFGVIYTLSGNLWGLIFLHSLYDIFSNMFESTEAMPDAVVYIEVFIFFLFTAGYLVYRIKHSDKASRLWKEKWKVPEKS